MGSGARAGSWAPCSRLTRPLPPRSRNSSAKPKRFRKDGDVYAADLTEAGAKSQLSFGGRRGGNAPEASNAKGSIRISLKDGMVTKYELRVQGTMTFNGEDRDVNRTTTIEIKDVGATKLEVPDDAKNKMS